MIKSSNTTNIFKSHCALWAYWEFNSIIRIENRILWLWRFFCLGMCLLILGASKMCYKSPVFCKSHKSFSHMQSDIGPTAQSKYKCRMITSKIGQRNGSEMVYETSSKAKDEKKRTQKNVKSLTSNQSERCKAASRQICNLLLILSTC